VVDTLEFLAKPRFKDKAFLHQKYIVKRLSSRQIADLYFSSRPTISKYLKIHGIAIRSCEARLPLKKVSLPRVSADGKSPSSVAEGAVIKTIVDLRSQGYSYRQVAAWLDANDNLSKS
jgi:hypothetical protein